MTVFDIVFVSPNGSSTGTGAIDDPRDTYASGLAAATAYANSQGKPWALWLLPGVYDEQVTQPAANFKIYVKLLAGAAIQYSGSGAAIQDDWSGNPLFLELDPEATIKTTTGNPAIDVNSSPFTIVGNATFDANASGDLITVSGGSLWLENALLTLTNSQVAGSLVNQSGGEVRLFGVHGISVDASNHPIVKSSGTMNLDGCRWMAATGKYAFATASQSIQVVNNVANVGPHANINETAGSTLVAPSYTI